MLKTLKNANSLPSTGSGPARNTKSPLGDSPILASSLDLWEDKGSALLTPNLTLTVSCALLGRTKPLCTKKSALERDP